MKICKITAAFLCAFVILPAFYSCGKSSEVINEKSSDVFSKNESCAGDESINIGEYITSQANANTSVYTSYDIPGDFDIYFARWINPSQKNYIDTYNEKIQKDLVTAATATCDFNIAEQDKIAIFKMLFAAFPEFFKIDKVMTSENLRTSDMEYYVTPLDIYEIRVTANGKTYSVSGDATAFHYKDENKEAAVFEYIVRYLENYMQNTEEYKSLPVAVGGYD